MMVSKRCHAFNNVFKKIEKKVKGEIKEREEEYNRGKIQREREQRGRKD